MGVDFEQECFFIAPIGDKGTETRRRSDGVRDWVVKPAAKMHGLETVRADDVGQPGQITAQAVQHCLKARAAVADLTSGNPNVYYELSVRHAAQLPVVLIAEQDTKLPFDVGQSRVIFFDHKDLADAARAKADLEEQIGASLTGPPDNPIADGMRLAKLEGGNVEEQTLAAMMDRLDRLAVTTEDIKARLRRVARRDEIRQAIRGAPTRWRGSPVLPPDIDLGEEVSPERFNEIMRERMVEEESGVPPRTHDEDEVIRLEEFEGDDSSDDTPSGRS